jgi:predicted Co/Zn/Cd cation transporter (cation efflux family)
VIRDIAQIVQTREIELHCIRLYRRGLCPIVAMQLQSCAMNTIVTAASTINVDDAFVIRDTKPFAAFVIIIGDVTVVALVVGVVFGLLLLMMLHDVISLITRTTDGK